MPKAKKQVKRKTKKSFTISFDEKKALVIQALIAQIGSEDPAVLLKFNTFLNAKGMTMDDVIEFVKELSDKVHMHGFCIDGDECGDNPRKTPKYGKK